MYPGGYLNAGWSPGYELSKLPLPDPLQALVYLSRVHLSLDDVQDGDVAVVVVAILGCRHHHVLGLRGGRIDWYSGEFGGRRRNWYSGVFGEMVIASHTGRADVCGDEARGW